ncbi:CpcT/CpeT family chromophore lyase [uncultured Croceitalea sp.]|uniref:CpcT/CpeT family chromophore lyase n=1 Tax=uncultured Croceitalea sp. TaxID=1798908 RepID=UPI003305F48B
MMNISKNNILGVCLLASAMVFTSCSEKKKKEVSEIEEPVIKVLSIDEQIDEIMNMWPGTYNNDKQIAEVESNGDKVWRLDDSGEDGWLHLQSHYIKLNAPTIGENVLYVEEYRDHDPSATYRQRIYTIAKDSLGEQIRVKMWPFKDKTKYVGAWENMSILDSLSVEEISAFPDICDLIVKNMDGKYNMKMNGRDCTFGSKTFNYEVMLSEGMFSYRDKITDKETDSVISTAANYAYHNLDLIKK